MTDSNPSDVVLQMLGELKQMVEQQAGEDHPQAKLVQKTMTYLRLHQKELDGFLTNANLTGGNDAG